MNFSEALKRIKIGDKICRSGWNGQKMYIFLVSGWTITESPASSIPVVPLLKFIAMKISTDAIVPWLASQTDILADDWEILN